MWVIYSVRYESTGALPSAEAAGESETRRQSPTPFEVVSGARSHPLYVGGSPLG